VAPSASSCPNSFTWASPATNGKETGVTVTFDAVDNATRVTLVHAGLADEAQRQRHHAGWQSIMDKLKSA
jgi:glutathione S-transferase